MCVCVCVCVCTCVCVSVYRPSLLIDQVYADIGCCLERLHPASAQS